jgi:hypothetical protein
VAAKKEGDSSSSFIRFILIEDLPKKARSPQSRAFVVKALRVVRGLFAEQAFEAVGSLFEGSLALFESVLAPLADKVT